MADEVLTRFGYRAIEAVHDNGVRPLVRVRTSFGDEILCTPEHRFQVRDEGGEGWREAGIPAPRRSRARSMSVAVTTGGSRRSRPVAPGYHTEIAARRSRRISTRPWPCGSGWIYGDGSITSMGERRTSSPCRSVTPTRRLVDRYCALTRGVFGSSVHLCVDRHEGQGGCVCICSVCVDPDHPLPRGERPAEGRCADLRCQALDPGLAGVGAGRISFRVCSRPTATSATATPGCRPSARHWRRMCTACCCSIGIPSKIGRIDDRRDGRTARSRCTRSGWSAAKGCAGSPSRSGSSPSSKHHRWRRR